MSGLSAYPLTLREANAFVAEHHRHHGPTRGMKFAIGARDESGTVGVVIVGRPVSRMLDDGVTAEVLRCCTTGSPNACSFLYSAAWRAARAMGYVRIITYTRSDESGVSVAAAGWRIVHRTSGGEWDRKGRRRRVVRDACEKIRWEREA